jgi:hypothetical protein
MLLDKFRGVFQAQLRFDVLPISFYGADGKMELSGNLAGAAAFADQAEEPPVRGRSIVRG